MFYVEIWNGCTFMKPTDAAFQKTGIDHPNDLSSWTVQKINRLISHHFFIGVDKFSSEFQIIETSRSGIKTEISMANSNVWTIKGGNKTF